MLNTETDWPPKAEELNPELKYFIEDHPQLGKCLKHPLVFSVPYFEAMNQMYNKSLEHKRKRVEEAKQARDWHQYIFWYERPYRITMFDSVKKQMTDKEYWECLAWVYVDLEFHYNYRRLLSKLFTLRPAVPEFIMDEDELQIWNSLTESVTIYRGVGKFPRAHLGMSWTLLKQKAEWFARRFNDDPYLLTGTIKKSNIIAYFAGRNEAEVVVRPKTVENIEWKKLKRKI